MFLRLIRIQNETLPLWLSLVVVASCLATAHGSITGPNDDRNNDVISIPSINYAPTSNPGTLYNPKSSRGKHLSSRFEGFNFLWFVLTRMNESPADQSTVSGSLSSGLSRKLLRYQKMFLSHKHVDESKNASLRMSRVVETGFIGFEMEFRIEKSSGSGYLIIGKSLGDGRENYEPDPAENVLNSSANFSFPTDIPLSWFGLYCKISGKRFALRLEYKNIFGREKQKFMLPIEHSDFRVQMWHKLAVHIDFFNKTVTYWVNCTLQPVYLFGRHNSTHSSLFSVFRLLKHRNKDIPPVQVTFKSVVVVDGAKRGLPRQCFSVVPSNITECTGGRVFMHCGPNCERTCDTLYTKDLHDCATMCLEGCHCPAGQVMSKGRCVLTQDCPCRIGSTSYPATSTHTINNERCSCVAGSWRCYAVARITQAPLNRSVLLGGKTNLSCVISGNPLPLIRWITPENANFRIVTRHGGRISNLFIDHVVASDAGVYTCFAERVMDGWASNSSAFVKVTSPAVITSLPGTVTVTLGSRVTSLDCVVTGLPPPRVAFAKVGSNISKTARHFAVGPGVFRLKLVNVKRSDGGEYRCYAMNEAGSAMKSSIILVKLPAPITMAFHKRPENVYVKRHNSAVFPCKIIGHSASTNVTWLKDGKLLTLEHRRIIQKKHKLVVRKVTSNDAGTYTCLVVRKNGNMQAKAKLSIKGRMQPWGKWTTCSATCGRGVTTRKRKCTGIPPTRKTCHGKFAMKRFCNTDPCPGTCSSFGDPHYTTFDGRHFNFQGDCGYVLSQDHLGNSFKIVQYNVGCGSRLSCVEKITSVLTFPDLTAVVEMNRNGEVEIGGMRVELPYVSTKGSLTVFQAGLYLIMHVGNEIEIKWAIPHRLYLTVSGKYKDRTQGLCGNFNSNPDDDRLTPKGRLSEKDLVFGQSWAVSERNNDLSCSSISTLSNPCNRDFELARRASGTCSYLLDRDRFGACHHVVPTEHYIGSCMLDVCSTSVKETNTYFCTALSAYAEECLRMGVVLNWRTEDMCPIHCSGRKVYMECGPKCVKYCSSMAPDGTICLAHNRCVSGCFCPNGTVLHDGKCVLESQCPCMFNDMVFANGSRHDMNCERCVCENGAWKCLFNSLLCDYPASVIRGPNSQVAPYGHSVSFCCVVVGVPAPMVRWYHNGHLIRTDREHSRKAEMTTYEDSNATLLLYNVSMNDIGMYSCRAVNILGSHNSNKAFLSVIDPFASSCNPTPLDNFVHLPDGCYIVSEFGGVAENVINLGKCDGNPCHTSSSDSLGNNLCSQARYCCSSSETQPVEVRCRNTFHANFLVTVVRQCACVICENRLTVVEGVVRAAGLGQPARHMKISYQGRTVGYTSNAGSFRLPIPNLPNETKTITLTISDVILKKYATTVKNLLVVPGQTTLHTIILRPCGARVRFNATRGLQYLFKPSQGYQHRMRLVIPPSSLIYNHRSEPYNGIVVAGITVLDKALNQAVLPGSSIAVKLSAEQQIFIPAVIVCVSLYNSSGGQIDLMPGRSASLMMTYFTTRPKLFPWVLDELTGFWRETRERIEVEPRRTKQRRKLFLVTAKIKRFNTAWALGNSNKPCYLRVNVLDSSNQTIPGVKISFKTKPNFSNKRHSRRRRLPAKNMPTYIEDLTTSNSNPNGVCLPVGCHETGMLFASRIGHDLVLLEPEAPNRGMGKVMEMPTSHNTNGANKFLDTNISTRQSHRKKLPYFMHKRYCEDTRPGLQTYIFRDKYSRNDGSLLSLTSSNHLNRVIETFVEDQSVATDILGRRKLRPTKYCHIQVKVIMHPSFYTRNIMENQRVIEAVTFLNTSSHQMSMLGWRHSILHTIGSSGDNNELKEQTACIEYLCDSLPENIDSDILVHLTIRHISNSNHDVFNMSIDSPKCNLTETLPVMTSLHLPDDVMSFEDDSLEMANQGGYVAIKGLVTDPPRLKSQTKLRRFEGTTLQQSKRKCLSSEDTGFVSAYFECW